MNTNDHKLKNILKNKLSARHELESSVSFQKKKIQWVKKATETAPKSFLKNIFSIQFLTPTLALGVFFFAFLNNQQKLLNNSPLNQQVQLTYSSEFSDLITEASIEYTDEAVENYIDDDLAE